MVASTALQVYGRPLETVLSFKYLGPPITATYDDWPEVITNLKKAWNIWARLSKILGRMGADTRMLGVFQLTIV